MNKISKLINKADSLQLKCNAVCSEIAREAQKYIDWTDEIQCEVKPGDGVTLFHEMYVCPASTFFQYVEKNGKISESDFRCLCI